MCCHCKTIDVMTAEWGWFSWTTGVQAVQQMGVISNVCKAMCCSHGKSAGHKQWHGIDILMLVVVVAGAIACSGCTCKPSSYSMALNST